MKSYDMPIRCADRGAPARPAALYPVFPDEGAVLRAVRRRLQPADRLRGPVSLATPCSFGFAAYISAYTVKWWAGRRSLASSRARLWPCSWAWWRVYRHSPAGHLLRDGDAGAGADGVLLLPAGAVHGGEDGIRLCRGGQCSASSISATTSSSTTLCLSFCGGFLIIHRTIHSPFGQVLKAIHERSAPYRSDTGSINTS